MIHVQPLCEHVIQIRAFKDGSEFGDPYVWSGTGVRVDEGVIEIVGCLDAPTPSIWRELRGLDAPTPSIWRELRVELRAAGWDKVIYKRYVGGKAKTHTVDLIRNQNGE
jgi:hypothetical protein